MRYTLLAVFLLFTETCVAQIEVKASENRPFLISNGNGTYLYGSTGDNWDSGWMGLWVDRERVAPPIRPYSRLVRGGRGFNPHRFSHWVCEVGKRSVRWISNDKEMLALWFRPSNDTLFWSSADWVTINADTTWFKFVASGDSSEVGMSNGLLSADSDVNEPVAWAHAQLLNLLAENDSLLYAGIPWFNEGWGRDTFISLPGFLVTGHFDVARKLLMRFAGWIDRDPKSPTYGRIPNRVRPGEDIAYNTADGTAWWMREVYEYGIYSGDYSLWDTLLAEDGAMRIALDAAVLKSDSLGFLMHGDADTWMDAVGPNGAHSPRGNRAIEIQALHYASFDNALRMTKNAPDAWEDAKKRLRWNVFANYYNEAGEYFYDRLMPDGRADTTMRPNQLFVYTIPMTPLVPPQTELPVLENAARETIHEHGVLSLSPEDTCFHPYHMDWHYPKDDAYHQGIAWVWLSGPAKSLLVRNGRGDLALKIAEYEAELIRERGLVGSLPELLDAMKRPGEDEIAMSGTTSQAWSLAEFLRTTYQDFLGIRPVIHGRDEPFWLFAPRIPEKWGMVETRVTCGGLPIQVRMQQFADSTVIDLLPEQKPTTPLAVKFFDIEKGITGLIKTDDPLHVVYRKKDNVCLADGVPTAQVKLTGWPYDKGPKELELAKPITRTDFTSLKDPDWEILAGDDIHCDIQYSLLLTRATDSLGDDDGGAGYVYPSDENFVKGILDIEQLEVRDAKDRYYFELKFDSLAQPGWHPEYGFQLTYAAICLHTENAKRTELGANSNLTLDTPAERIIYVGGGVRVEDERGKILGEFIPRDNKDAFGNVATSTISFCLPKSLFPPNDGSWTWTIFSGAQDDHGGAGIGEFRSVKPAVERWAGGGNEHDGPNIYDRLSTLSPK
ncbi:hypothetical protein IT157_09615 [bacterium]|nr:hypothetical protein [bacterium]